MRRHPGLIGLALMSLALGACGSDGTATTTTTATFTRQQLSDAFRILMYTGGRNYKTDVVATTTTGTSGHLL